MEGWKSAEASERYFLLHWRFTVEALQGVVDVRVSGDLCLSRCVASVQVTKDACSAVCISAQLGCTTNTALTVALNG